MKSRQSWQSNTNKEILKCRATLLRSIREFFYQNNTLEVDTPTLSMSTTPDPNIDSFITSYHSKQYYLHTSPEFPMKRLLASGSGAIYQICKVFRHGEAGNHHNPEFTMLEWYQPDMTYHALMKQLDELLRILLKERLTLNDTLNISYQNLFDKYLKINPHVCSKQELLNLIQQHKINLNDASNNFTRDALLDVLVTHIIQPSLPKNTPIFVFDYPKTQAALAEIREGEECVAERFELYLNGLELANGYQELLDADEMQSRFEKENQQREAENIPTIPLDNHLIAAQRAGMPMVSGVAVGIDRLLMLVTGAESIQEVIAFSFDKA